MNFLPPLFVALTLLIGPFQNSFYSDPFANSIDIPLGGNVFQTEGENKEKLQK
jgi:hypothetical protein